MAAKRPAKKKTTTTTRKEASVGRRAGAGKQKPAKQPPLPPGPAGPAGRVAEIQQIIEVMTRAGAVEVEMEDPGGGRLRVRLKEEHAPSYLTHAPIAPGSVSPQTNSGPLAAGSPSTFAAEPAEEEGEIFPSPMVGTFYRSASPEAEAFVGLGDDVDEESTLCIIEAMKVMNEIKAEQSGRIVAILVENGEPVEFGQPLFRIQRG